MESVLVVEDLEATAISTETVVSPIATISTSLSAVKSATSRFTTSTSKFNPISVSVWR